MPLPFVTLPDPKTDAEGGIDPLGIAVIADRLADDMLPGLTARMSRPRFLTAIAVASAALDDLEARAEDGTPPFLALEWIAVQAFALMDEEVRRIPGMLKARAALRDGAPMSARRYLKTASVFGFHGVYKTLAKALGIVDDDLHLRPNGERLVSAWEKACGLDGFLAGAKDSPGGKLRARLRASVEEALAQAHAPPPKGVLLELFQQHLRPDTPTKAEAALLHDLFAAPEGGTRGEVFALYQRKEVRGVWEENTERAFLRFVQSQASPELRATLVAIEAFEKVARPVQDALDHALHLSTRQRGAISVDDFTAAVPDLLGDLPRALEEARTALVGRSSTAEVESFVADLEGVRTNADLFQAMLRRHEQAQRRKPPNGKRPWFERLADGRVVVRPLYRREEAPPAGDRFVHFYRTFSVMSFLDDLGGAR